MRKLISVFTSLYLAFVLVAPVAMAGDNHSGRTDSPPPSGGGIVRPVFPKGIPGVVQVMSFLSVLNRVTPIL
jgi:hypothetical protein